MLRKNTGMCDSLCESVDGECDSVMRFSEPNSLTNQILGNLRLSLWSQYTDWCVACKRFCSQRNSQSAFRTNPESKPGTFPCFYNQT
mmetsp:Transcript_16910/g.36793  ORF Transcript_16910/g.36793 Transcript_16910/m.36793 type:complete len:87 (+) Transcript_16910:56-316(+)